MTKFCGFDRKHFVENDCIITRVACTAYASLYRRRARSIWYIDMHPEHTIDSQISPAVVSLQQLCSRVPQNIYRYVAEDTDLGETWAVLILGFHPTTMGHSMLKERWSVGRLNFNMGLPIPVGRNRNIDTTLCCRQKGNILP